MIGATIGLVYTGIHSLTEAFETATRIREIMSSHYVTGAYRTLPELNTRGLICTGIGAGTLSLGSIVFGVLGKEISRTRERRQRSR